MDQQPTPEIDSKGPSSPVDARSKLCRGCARVLSRDSFYGRRGGKRVHTRCRDCMVASAHRRTLHKTYGITPAQYDGMLEAQGGVCFICGGPDWRALSVDHCHKTGRVRGLLCSNCNRALGLLGDDADLVARALEYLRRPRG